MKDDEFITETFVTFGQAKTLEELGFDGYKWDCDFWYYYNYHNHDEPLFARYEQVDSYDVEKYWYAPTLAHAQKWLREVKQIYLFVTRENSHYYWYIDKKFQIGNSKSYEDALIAGIEAALELLK